MNEKLKQSFINDTYKHDFYKNHKAFFKCLEEQEGMLNKDLKDFNEKEIKKLVKCVTSYSSLVAIFSFIRKYKEYCMVFGYDSYQIDWEDETMSAPYYRNTFNSNFVSKTEYQELLYLLDESDPYQAYVKILVMSVYEGISGVGFEDLMHLKEENINGNTVTFKSRTIEISNELKVLLDKGKRIRSFKRGANLVFLNPLEEGCIFNVPLPKENDEKAMKRIADNLSKYILRELKRRGYDNISINSLGKSAIVQKMTECYLEDVDADGKVSLGKDSKKDKRAVELLSSRGLKNHLPSFVYKNKNMFKDCKKELL